MKSLEHLIAKHSEHFEQMVSRTTRYGKLENADGYGLRTGVCGDSVEMFLKVSQSGIEKVFFQIDGCCHTMAAANTVSYLAEGCSLASAWEIAPEKVAEYLETLPPDHFHCAELAVGAFYNALTDYGRRQEG